LGKCTIKIRPHPDIIQGAKTVFANTRADKDTLVDEAFVAILGHAHNQTKKEWVLH
jgi:hypothetical protein